MSDKIPHASVKPRQSLNLLSLEEVAGLTSSSGELFRVFRNCALAILNTGSQMDDSEEVLAEFFDFDIQVIPQARGFRLELFNAPAQSFVDGKMIRGIREHLFSALRDIVYTDFKITGNQPEPADSAQITNMVFRILRNAGVVRPNIPPRLAVCWGGHAIPRTEYDYAKQVGYELGLRGLDIVTGCGIGAMKGPMKGAAVGHAKQQVHDGRYIGITEPGIIASESPNAAVNELIIMPDIEKRLEAFVRLGHCIIVFPGGVGTVEEILYLLSILMHPENNESLPMILAGPENCRDYFNDLEAFLQAALGEQASKHYQLIIGEPDEVGRQSRRAVNKLHTQRRKKQQAYYFNWTLRVDHELQKPFVPTHEAMAQLNLSADRPAHELAQDLRRAFSGLVAGNVKSFGIEQVKRNGPYQLSGDAHIMKAMDTLLRTLVRQGRMKLGVLEEHYRPCYEISG
ncbi:MAG: nucleotide 5'-monophosphate nucleosidase PpnN [Pseudomonadota bacterium]